MAYLHKIKALLHDNVLTEDPNDFIACVVAEKSLGIEDICLSEANGIFFVNQASQQKVKVATQFGSNYKSLLKEPRSTVFERSFFNQQPMEVIMTKTKGLFFTAGTALAKTFTFSRSSGGGGFMNMTAKRVFLIGLLVMLAAGSAFAQKIPVTVMSKVSGISNVYAEDFNGKKFIVYYTSEANVGKVKFTFTPSYTNFKSNSKPNPILNLKEYDRKGTGTTGQFVEEDGKPWSNTEHITKARNNVSWKFTTKEGKLPESLHILIDYK